MEKYQELESEFGRFAGYTQEQTVACSSGTAALHLALEALQLPQGSEVILCDYNMIACARAVTLAGFRPVFVDCDDRLLISVDKVADYLERREFNGVPKAVLATHIYGRACDMQQLADLAGKYELKLVEDLAEAHGVPPHPNTDAACWSFYRNKIVAGEEGGAVAFRDEKHAKRARSLRSLGFGHVQDYQHIPRGHNYRLANLLATPILQSLQNYKMWLKYRRMVEGDYEAQCPQEWKMPYRDAPWVYDIRIPGMQRYQQDRVVAALRSEGIEARHGFVPMSFQEEYWKPPLPISLKFMSEIIYLPLVQSIQVPNMCSRAFEIIKTIHLSK